MALPDATERRAANVWASNLGEMVMRKLLVNPVLFASSIATHFASAIVIILILHVFFDVLFRYLFGLPLLGTVSYVAKIYMPIICFLTIAEVERNNRSISVEVLHSVMSAGVRGAIGIISNILSIIVFSALAVSTWRLSVRGYGAYDDFGSAIVYTWPGYFVLPISFGIAAMMLTIKLFYKNTNIDRAN